MGGEGDTEGRRNEYERIPGGHTSKKDIRNPQQLPIDGLAARAVAGREVTALAHKVRDDTVKSGALEVQGLAGAARPLLASAERAEVLRGLRHDIGAQSHFNAAQGLAGASGAVKEDNGVGHD